MIKMTRRESTRRALKTTPRIIPFFWFDEDIGSELEGESGEGADGRGVDTTDVWAASVTYLRFMSIKITHGEERDAR